MEVGCLHCGRLFVTSVTRRCVFSDPCLGACSSVTAVLGTFHRITYLSPFTFHLGFVHPLQDVPLHQCLPLSCYLLLGRPLDLFPLLGCHSVQHLVHLLFFILAICPAHIHFCFSVYSIMSITFVLFLISEHGNFSYQTTYTYR